MGFDKIEINLVFWKIKRVPPKDPIERWHPEKMTPQWLPMTPIFYFKILKHYENEIVCKKLEQKISRIDWMASVFAQKRFFFNSAEIF